MHPSRLTKAALAVAALGLAVATQVGAFSSAQAVPSDASQDVTSAAASVNTRAWG